MAKSKSKSKQKQKSIFKKPKTSKVPQPDKETQPDKGTKVDKWTQISQETGITFQGKNCTWETALDAVDVVDLINKQETVLSLNLDGNRLGLEAAKAIGEALKWHPEFRKAVWSNMFGSGPVKKIPEVLQTLGAGLVDAGARLTVLDLSNNALGPKLMMGLGSSVSHCLQKLLLVNCNLGPGGAVLLSQDLVKLHKRTKKAGIPCKLVHLDIKCNEIKNVGARALANAFNKLQTLECISVEDNKITFNGVKALARSLVKHTKLKSITFSGNTLKSKGAGEIADLLPFLPDLQSLQLAASQIPTIGALRLADTLKNSNLLLKTANFSCNKIQAVGIVALVKAMTSKPKLSVFNIAGNPVAPEKLAIAIEPIGEKITVITSPENATYTFNYSQKVDSDVSSESEDELEMENDI